MKMWPRALQTTEACRASTERDKKWPRALRKAIRPVISGLYMAILLHLAQDRTVAVPHRKAASLPYASGMRHARLFPRQAAG